MFRRPRIKEELNSDWSANAHRAFDDIRGELRDARAQPQPYSLRAESARLPVDDLPAAWNEKYDQFLGVRPLNDADGVLQDIHWSGGAIGYFPTYTLGNLCAAQFFEVAEREIGPLDEQFAAGEFAPLLDWLRRNVHRRGMCYAPAELVEVVAAAPLSHEPLMRYLRGKLGPLYRLDSR